MEYLPVLALGVSGCNAVAVTCYQDETVSWIVYREENKSESG